MTNSTSHLDIEVAVLLPEREALSVLDWARVSGMNEAAAVNVGWGDATARALQTIEVHQ